MGEGGPMNGCSRVGIFQAQWPLQAQTANCSIVLAKAGYQVDLVLYDAPEYYESDRLRRTPGITVHSFDKPSVGSKSVVAAAKTYAKSRGWLRWPYSVARRFVIGARELVAIARNDEGGLIPDGVLREAAALMAGKEYHCLIGVEKKGLIWAGKMAATSDIPYLYYSLELYTSDHPESTTSMLARRTRMVEKKYHKKSVATIIQDSDRAAVLLEDNGIDKQDVLYVPVSLLGEPYKNESSLLQDKFPALLGKNVVLQFGILSEARLSFELAKVAQSFPAESTLVFHGYGRDEDIAAIQGLDVNDKVICSLDMLPSERICELIASAHIGLALYSSTPLNDRLTAFASEKVALYLKCGLPIIAFDYPGFRRLIDEYECGVVIGSLRELPGAVQEVLESYERMRRRAYECYADRYDYAKNFQTVIAYMGEQLTVRSTAAGQRGLLGRRFDKSSRR